MELPRSSIKKRPPPLDPSVLETPVSAFAAGPPSGPLDGGGTRGGSDAPISPLSGLLTGLGSRSGTLPDGAADGQVQPQHSLCLLVVSTPASAFAAPFLPVE